MNMRVTWLYLRPEGMLLAGRQSTSRQVWDVVFPGLGTTLSPCPLLWLAYLLRIGPLLPLSPTPAQPTNPKVSVPLLGQLVWTMPVSVPVLLQRSLCRTWLVALWLVCWVRSDVTADVGRHSWPGSELTVRWCEHVPVRWPTPWTR